MVSLKLKETDSIANSINSTKHFQGKKEQMLTDSDIKILHK